MAVLRTLRNPIVTGRYVCARHRELKPGEERFEVEAPISLSPNSCGILFWYQNCLPQNRWTTLEDNRIDWNKFGNLS